MPSNYPPATGTFDFVSSTQVTTFERCEREWFIKYIKGVEVPPTAAMLFGTELHRQLEVYYKTGQQPSNLSAYKAIEHLPPRAPDLLVEADIFDLGLKLEGVPVRGVLDLLVPPRGRKVADLWDHKSTSARKWAKTPEKLLRDPQLTIYARATLERFPGIESVNAAHSYMLKSPADSWPVHVSLPVDTINENWLQVGSTVRRMKSAALVGGWENATPNKKSCGAYGGCPFLGKFCKFDPIEEIVGLLDDLDAQLTVDEGAQAAIATASAVLPPDAPKPSKLKIEDEPASVAAPTEEKPKRGRPAKTKTTDQVPAGEGSPVGNPRQISETATGAGSPAVAKDSAPLELYVDCVPTRLNPPRGWRHLADVIAIKSAAICRERNVPDLRLLPYGEGKALLCAAIKADPPSGVILANQSEFQPAVLETLLPSAAVCVIGTR